MRSIHTCTVIRIHIYNCISIYCSPLTVIYIHDLTNEDNQVITAKATSWFWLYRYYDYFMNKLIPYQSDKSLIYWISFLIVRFLWFSRNSKLLSIHQLFYMYFYTIPIFNVVFDPVHLMIWTNIYPYKCISLFPKLIVTHKAAITLIDLTSSKSIHCLLYP